MLRTYIKFRMDIMSGGIPPCEDPRWMDAHYDLDDYDSLGIVEGAKGVYSLKEGSVLWSCVGY
jgi:hypothetical protein